MPKQKSERGGLLAWLRRTLPLGRLAEAAGAEEDPNEFKAEHLYSEPHIVATVGKYLQVGLPRTHSAAFTPFHRVTDVRIAIATAVAVVGIYGSWKPKYPESAGTIVVCLVTFFILVALLAVFDSLLVQTSVFAYREKGREELEPISVDVLVDSEYQEVAIGIRHLFPQRRENETVVHSVLSAATQWHIILPALKRFIGVVFDIWFLRKKGKPSDDKEDARRLWAFVPIGAAFFKDRRLNEALVSKLCVELHAAFRRGTRGALPGHEGRRATAAKEGKKDA